MKTVLGEPTQLRHAGALPHPPGRVTNMYILAHSVAGALLSDVMFRWAWPPRAAGWLGVQPQVRAAPLVARRGKAAECAAFHPLGASRLPGAWRRSRHRTERQDLTNALLRCTPSA
jgi:hypothetical protein